MPSVWDHGRLSQPVSLAQGRGFINKTGLPRGANRVLPVLSLSLGGNTHGWAQACLSRDGVSCQ